MVKMYCAMEGATGLLQGGAHYPRTRRCVATLICYLCLVNVLRRKRKETR
jgi:hypothetical protein